MKLLRFISEEEKLLIERISKRSFYTTPKAYDNNFDYSGIQYTENRVTKCFRNVINRILKQVIDDFVSINNFTEDGRMRVQYRWDKDNSFVGVGYITLDELKNGFNNTLTDKENLDED